MTKILSDIIKDNTSKDKDLNQLVRELKEEIDIKKCYIADQNICIKNYVNQNNNLEQECARLRQQVRNLTTALFGEDGRRRSDLKGYPTLAEVDRYDPFGIQVGGGSGGNDDE